MLPVPLCGDEMPKNNVKLLALALALSLLVLILVLSWLDGVFFGGTWRNYVVGTAIEIGCFLVGVLVGYLIWGEKE